MNVSPTLARAYAETAYRVALPHAVCVVRIGAVAPVIDAYCATQHCCAWGIVTAVNPASVPWSDAENATRLAALRRDLAGLSDVVRPVDNVDPNGHWPTEAAYWVGGASLASLLDLAVRYGQWAIVFAECGQAARLEWTPDALRTVESGP